jgi:hypothetical protein
MRALRRWIRKARCRAKYGRACPHGGHNGGKRRNSVTSAQTHARKPAKDSGESHHPPAHRAKKRAIDRARADA